MGFNPLEFLFYGLGEWFAAFAVIWWISRGWGQIPPSALERLMRHPRRPWWMVGFGVAVPMLWLLLRSALVAFDALGPILFLVTMTRGVLVGLAASCCAAPLAAGQPFRYGAPAVVSAVVIFIAHLLRPLIFISPFAFFLGDALAIVGTLLVSQAKIITVAPRQPGATPEPRDLTPALLIGFFPAGLVLAFLAISRLTNGHMSREAAVGLGLCCVVSVVCCFTASTMLFKRHTAGALAGGILLLLLNGFIAFSFGCVAVASQIHF